jgi:hypothetical protein
VEIIVPGLAGVVVVLVVLYDDGGGVWRRVLSRLARLIPLGWFGWRTILFPFLLLSLVLSRIMFEASC